VRRPNVVVITLESVAASHVGFLGYKRPTTPNLDAIAARSLVMTRAYTTATHSNYAQMAVISSLFPRRGAALDMYQRLDYPRVLLHDLGHDLGYSTATISSQDETWQGMKRFEDTGTPTFYRHAPDYQGEHLDLGTEDVAPDHATAEEVAKYIAAHASERFTVYVNFQSTHFPYPIPKDAPRPFQPFEPKGTFNYVRWDHDDLDTIVNRYDDALAYVDAQIGVIEAALESHHLENDTIVVVTSDHGELFFDHDIVTHGRTLFDGESRVPLLVSYPAGLAPGEDATPVSTLDVLPTIVDLMDLPPHPAFQGESFAHVRDGKKPRGAVFMNIQGWKHYDGIVCMPYKLVFDPDSGESTLYDLVKDPGEATDLAKEKAAVTEKLYTTLRAQLDAQEAYHADDETGHALRGERFAPRMLPCPTLD
jgi:arylsulfatase A-like enzyme